MTPETPKDRKELAAYIGDTPVGKMGDIEIVTGHGEDILRHIEAAGLRIVPARATHEQKRDMIDAWHEMPPVMHLEDQVAGLYVFALAASPFVEK